MKATGTRPKIIVTADGKGVVGHAGARLLADLAEATGLSGQFSQALAGLRQREGGHDPGRVAVDLAMMIADGGEAISDLAVLRGQVELFGPVAAAHRGPDHPQRQTNPATHRRFLAVGGRAGRRVHPPGRTPHTGHLTPSSCCCPPSTTPGTRPAPAGLLSLPTAQ